MAKGSKLIDAIRAIVPPHSGTRPWYERVTGNQAVELAEVLAAYKRGEFGPRRRTAARAIAKGLASIGITIGEQAVEAWLKRS
jgi:hypothetical protein